MFVVAASYFGVGTAGAGDERRALGAAALRRDRRDGGTLRRPARAVVGDPPAHLLRRLGRCWQAADDRMAAHWPVFVAGLILSAPVWWHALRHPQGLPLRVGARSPPGRLEARRRAGRPERRSTSSPPRCCSPGPPTGSRPDRFDAIARAAPAAGGDSLSARRLPAAAPAVRAGRRGRRRGGRPGAVGRHHRGLGAAGARPALAGAGPPARPDRRPLVRRAHLGRGDAAPVRATSLQRRTAADAAFVGPVGAGALGRRPRSALAAGGRPFKARAEEGEARLVRSGLWTVAGLLTLFGVTGEIRRYFELESLSPVTAELAAGLAVSAWWLIFAAALILVGFRRAIKPLRVAGLAVAGLAVVKVVFFDLSSLDALYRVGSVFFLALVMLSLAYVYYRHDRSERDALRQRRHHVRDEPAGFRRVARAGGAGADARTRASARSGGHAAAAPAPRPPGLAAHEPGALAKALAGAIRAQYGDRLSEADLAMVTRQIESRTRAGREGPQARPSPTATSPTSCSPPSARRAPGERSHLADAAGARAAAPGAEGVRGGAGGALPRPAGAPRPGLQRGGDGAPRAGARRGPAAGRRAGVGEGSRSAARHPLRRQGPARRGRRAHHLGSPAVPRARCSRATPPWSAGFARPGAVLCAKLAMVELAGGMGYNQAFASFTGPGTVALGSGPVVGRIVQRIGVGGRGGAGSVRDRIGDLGLDSVSGGLLRRDRPATHLRPGEPARRDGAELDDGQAGPAGANGGGLRDGARGHRRPRSARTRRRSGAAVRLPGRRQAAEALPARHPEGHAGEDPAGGAPQLRGVAPGAARVRRHRGRSSSCRTSPTRRWRPS